MKVLDSTVPCPRCGDPMRCVLTGPDTEPDSRATYVCRNADWEGNCNAAAFGRLSLQDAPPIAPEGRSS